MSEIEPSPARRPRPRRLVAGILLGVLVLGAGALLVKEQLRPSYTPPVAAAEPLSADVAAQMAYLDEHWEEANVDEFGTLGGTDCVNFTSQTLLARGWGMDDDWGHSRSLVGAHAYTRAWISSTAFRDYLAARPERATALDDTQRAELAVGDVAQFDWDASGDRDHTAVVTAVIPRDDGTVDVRLGGHSPSYREMPVDRLLAEHEGAVVHYWHLAD
ncbi:amidase domain-containing protein [Homoserinibacter sp. YIM 151385]|uniref:amidase domain-containing protein n=1 Tax=Homoserinibacter sp. YIM 151385 TaxID=2985506 RepID=UPI0022F0FDCD|nr:amidase domain-containing protein [Homoserinibacter sp. YIM 151385]WBU38523.1 amidase domain-containing protein [Homoserinibacter sp. YIM 151385]